VLTPPGDVEALTAALERVLNDADYRRALGRAARLRAVSQFGVDAMTEAYLRLYGAGPRRRGSSDAPADTAPTPSHPHG
jgi:glycosyltransferase involved in cell wall biosynthesis